MRIIGCAQLRTKLGSPNWGHQMGDPKCTCEEHQVHSTLHLGYWLGIDLSLVVALCGHRVLLCFCACFPRAAPVMQAFPATRSEMLDMHFTSLKHPARLLPAHDRLSFQRSLLSTATARLKASQANAVDGQPRPQPCPWLMNCSTPGEKTWPWQQRNLFPGDRSLRSRNSGTQSHPKKYHVPGVLRSQTCLRRGPLPSVLLAEVSTWQRLHSPWYVIHT
jgi:hypothetical protein